MSGRYLITYLTLTLLSILVNWPGRVNPDTVDMLWQAQNPEHISDWHSPFITFSYGILWPLFGYPGGALVLQSALLMLWPALVTHALLISRTSQPIRHIFLIAWLAVCVVFITLAGQIIKDVFIVGLYSSIFFLIGLYGRTYDAIFNKMSGWICFLGLCLVLSRITNAFVLLATGATLVGFLLHKSKWKIKYGIYLLITVVSMTIGITCAGSLFGASKSHPERHPIIFDLAGISHYTGTNQFFLDSEVKFTKGPSECYTAKQADPFVWGPCGEYDAYLRSKEGIVQHWIFAVLTHPTAYLRHRIKFAVELLKKDGGANEALVPTPPFDQASNTNKYNVVMPENRAPIMATWRPTISFIPFGVISGYILSSPLGHPLLWCLILIANLIIMIYYKARLGQLLLSIAGLSNVVAFILLGGSDDLRYLLPTFFCALAVLAYRGRDFMVKYQNIPMSGRDA